MENKTSGFRSVMIADDDPDDCMLFEDAISELQFDIHVDTVKDGEELINYLKSAVIIPDMLFLDLNMPRKNGFQCLREIRETPDLKNIFVVVYSTTSNQREVDEVFDLGTNKFIRKPNSYSELKKVLNDIFSENF